MPLLQRFLPVRTVANELAINGKEYIDSMLPISKFPRKQGYRAKLQMYWDVFNSRPIADITVLQSILEKLLAPFIFQLTV